MKKRAIKRLTGIFAAVLLTFTLSGCDTYTDAFSEYNAEDYYIDEAVFEYYDEYLTFEEDGGENENTAENLDLPTITQAQALEDYRRLWDVLEENYPFFGVTGRLHGVNKSEVAFFYEEIIKHYDTLPVYFFNHIIDNCLYEFQGLGHLNTIYPEEYLMYCSVYSAEEEDMEIFGVLNEALNDENVKNMYTQMLPENAEEEFGEYVESMEDGSLSNIEFEFLSDKTAYMNILSFEYYYVGADHEKIMDFYDEIKGYDSLIIDLTENGGGSKAYWADNIVAPNITDYLEISELSMAKKGELNMRYFGDLGLLPYIIPKSVHTNKANLSQTDYEDLNMGFSWWSIIEPAGEEKKFDGDIYVLTDDSVYSASESFVMFCKKTGFATLVGKPTGGDGGGIDPVISALPNSGLLFRFSPLYTLNADGSNNEEFGTLPDIPCEDGEEPLDACLRAIDERAKTGETNQAE